MGKPRRAPHRGRPLPMGDFASGTAREGSLPQGWGPGDRIMPRASCGLRLSLLLETGSFPGKTAHPSLSPTHLPGNPHRCEAGAHGEQGFPVPHPKTQLTGEVKVCSPPRDKNPWAGVHPGAVVPLAVPRGAAGCAPRKPALLPSGAARSTASRHGAPSTRAAQQTGARSSWDHLHPSDGAPDRPGTGQGRAGEGGQAAGCPPHPHGRCPHPRPHPSPEAQKAKALPCACRARLALLLF